MTSVPKERCSDWDAAYERIVNRTPEQKSAVMRAFDLRVAAAAEKVGNKKLAAEAREMARKR